MRLSAQASLRHTDTHRSRLLTPAHDAAAANAGLAVSTDYTRPETSDASERWTTLDARSLSPRCTNATRRAAARRVFGVALAAHTGQGHYIETYTGTRHTAALTVSVRTRERELRVADSDTSSSTPTEPDPARRPPAPPGGDRRTLDTLYCYRTRASVHRSLSNILCSRTRSPLGTRPARAERGTPHTVTDQRHTYNHRRTAVPFRPQSTAVIRSQAVMRYPPTARGRRRAANRQGQAHAHGSAPTHTARRPALAHALARATSTLHAAQCECPSRDEPVVRRSCRVVVDAAAPAFTRCAGLHHTHVGPGRSLQA